MILLDETCQPRADKITVEPASARRWAVILAGGEGVRLRTLTQLVSGADTPKQFCPLLGGRTLLAQTRQRIARGVSPERTVFVMLRSHERFYANELKNVSSDRVIAQPEGRGTLPAILASLIKVVRQDPDALVAFFPSDHHYSEEDRFVSGVELAFEAAEANPESVILLGVAAKHAETEYGWIEAEPAISTESSHGLLKVKRFWEKPSVRTAHELLLRGCVWNTFVMLGRAGAFLEMIRSSIPDIFMLFEPLLQGRLMDESKFTEMLGRIYDRVPEADFSKLVLSQLPDRLGVWCLGDVGWNDLGDPRRVLSVLSEAGVENEWMNLWNERFSVTAAGQGN